MTSSQDTEADLPGLPRPAVDGWLNTVLADRLDGQAWQAEIISGGLSNITYRLHTATGRMILRRPPLGGVLQSAHDMGREVRVLTALADTPVPVPRVLGFCADPETIGVPFYVMDEVAGVVVRTSADSEALDIHQRAALGHDLARVLASLHAVEPESAGLSDFGRHTGYAARLISRWSRQWQASQTRALPEMDELIRRLSESVPEDSGLAIVHGDYRLDNTIVDLADPAHIVAVVDWELSTLGDPLADLALALVYWHDIGDEERDGLSVAHRVTAHPGFPTSAEFTQEYARLTGADLTDLPFHVALASMKLAVILEGVHARYVGGHTASAGYEGVEKAVPVLVTRALRALDENGSRP